YYEPKRWPAQTPFLSVQSPFDALAAMGKIRPLRPYDDEAWGSRTIPVIIQQPGWTTEFYARPAPGSPAGLWMYAEPPWIRVRQLVVPPDIFVIAPFPLELFGKNKLYIERDEWRAPFVRVFDVTIIQNATVPIPTYREFVAVWSS